MQCRERKREKENLVNLAHSSFYFSYICSTERDRYIDKSVL